MRVNGDEFGFPRYEPANVLTDDRYFDNLSGQQACKSFARAGEEGVSLPL